MIDIEKFHVVFYFDHTQDDYEIAGIFTIKSDAQARAFMLKAKNLPGVGVAELTLNAVKEMLMRERMGRVAESIAYLENFVRWMTDEPKYPPESKARTA